MLYIKNEYKLYKEIIGGFTRYFAKSINTDGEWSIEVSREVYLEILKSQRKQEALTRSDRRHLDKSELNENAITTRLFERETSLEEIAGGNISNEMLRKALSMLPDIQRRRIELYFFCECTYKQIAEMEGCTEMPVKRSIDRAIDKIKTFFEFRGYF